MDIFFIIKKLWREICLLIFVLLACTCAGAYANVSQEEFPDNQFKDIVDTLGCYENEWKLDEIDNRIYIKSEAILLAKNQMYLVVDQIFIPLSDLHCDETGYFLCAEGYFYWTCCKCNWKNSYTVFTCQNCKKESCRDRKKK